MASLSDFKAQPIRNVVVLLADQHRADCVGCYGNRTVQTPHIDALADTGVRFTHAFTPAAICTPARACLQSGLMPRNHGLIFNWEFQRFRGGELNVPPDVRFFSQNLAHADYQLAHIGKWHIGDINTPADYGYEGIHYPGYGYPSTHEHYLAYLKRHGVDGFHLSRECRDPDRRMLYHALQKGPPEVSIPHYLAEQTTEKIRSFSQSDRPFFVSCNFWGPHAPFRIPNPYFDMYDPADCEPWPNFHADLSQKPDIIRRQGQRFCTDWFTDDVLRDQLARHYGYVTLIDEQIGRIIQTLRDCGELEHTLIIYTADHGSADGSFRMWDKGFGMYDCLWQVPMIASHPSLRPGVSDAFVSLLDLAPTFTQIAGQPLRDELDGESLLPLLRGERSSVRDDHMIFEHHGHQVPFWQRMIRTRDAKYIYNPTDRDEYYDLAADPDEMHNLIDTVSTDRVEPLRKLLREHINATNDPVRGWAGVTL